MLEIDLPNPVVHLHKKAAPDTDGTSAKVLASESAPLEGIIESLELVRIDPKSVQEMFTLEGALKPLLSKIAEDARSIVLDATTAKGRDGIKALAYKIAQAKTTLEKQGKELGSKLKELPRLVDANKRQAWDFLEALQAEIRKPLTDWEAEQARIEAKRKADEEAAILAREIESDHEIALTLNWAYDQKEKEEFAALEKAAQEREGEIAREAIEQEKEKVRLELKAIAQREDDAKAQAEKAEQDRLEAEERQKDAEAREAQARIDADARAIQAKKDADERAEQAAIEATQRERRRQAEAAQAEADAQAAREADREHRGVVNREALADLVAAGIPTEMAKLAVSAIAQSMVRHTRITY